MPFLKLDVAILDSTLWIDRDARDVFITALLMARPKRISRSQKQLSVLDDTECEFTVPVGWYGFVESSGQGIVRRALVEYDAGMDALKRLGEPDKQSRSPEHNGRRIVRVPGGFVVLNFVKYREKDHTNALRQRRYRQTKAEVTALRNGKSVTVTQADAEAYTDKVKVFSPQAGKLKAYRIPENFSVTLEHVQWAKQNHMPDPHGHIGAFVDFWTAKPGRDGTKLDWDATFRNWIRNSVARNGGSNGNGRQQKRTGLDCISEQLSALTGELAD